MPVLLFVVIGLVILLIAAAVVGAYFGWKAYTRRALLRLLARAEAVQAATGALTVTVERMATASDEELEVFATDATSIERRALAEIASRSAILVDELDRTPMPRKFVPLAEALADAAYVVHDQSSKVQDEDRGDLALDALASLDLGIVRAYTEKARILLKGACDVCGLDETAVYGGGLYL